jgi:hypothetical protein
MIASADGSSLLLVRLALSVSAVVAVVVALSLAVMMIAGNRTPESRPAATFALTFLVVLGIQGGYLAAPFVVGGRGWSWAFWTTAPIGTLMTALLLVPAFQSLGWTPPEGGSRALTFLRYASGAGLAALLYLVPPALLWWFRV